MSMKRSGTIKIVYETLKRFYKAGVIKSYYDSESDVLYVSCLKDAPSSYCEEVDDFLLIERSIESKQITGYRILNFSKFKEMGEI